MLFCKTWQEFRKTLVLIRNLAVAVKLHLLWCNFDNIVSFCLFVHLFSFCMKTSIFKVLHQFVWRWFPLNVQAVRAKIRSPKKHLQHSHVLRKDKKNLSILLLPRRPRKRKLDLKLSIFQLKRCFMSVQNKMAPVFSTFLRDLESIFLRMLESFIVGSRREVNRSEMFQIALKINVTMLWVVF